MNTRSAFVTKIVVPRRRPDTIRRARLLDALARRSEGRLAIVRAPAGFGKTTLLVDLAHEAAGSVCWISLDEWDRDAATFLQYLSLSVGRRFGSLDAKSGHGWSAHEPRAALGSLTAQIADHGEDTWIILDDFHCLDGSKEVPDLIDYLARRLPSNCRLVMASRTPPPLPSLPRLRLEGKAVELGPADLAFAPDEIAQSYRSMRGQTISKERAQRIFRFTQGWPAAVSLFRDPETLGDEDRQGSVSLSDYLAAEVFDRLPAKLRRFLTRTSVLDTLEAAACDAILHERKSAQLLAILEKQNVPIMRIEGAATEHRIHPLFRDFLRSKLRLESPELYHDLNQDAGQWHAAAGRSGEAIWHFAQAESWDQVNDLILEEAPGTYKAGRWHTIVSLLETMPAAELRIRPQLRLWEARVLVRLGRGDEALRVVSEMVGSLREPDPVILAQLETIRATALRVKGDVAWALASCQRAVELATTGNATIDVLAEARKQLGHVLFSKGSFAEAAREFRGVLETYEQRGDMEDAAFVNGCLGSALGSLGELAEAASTLEKARQQWRKIGNVKELSWVLNNLAMIYYLMGQIDLARELFNDSLTKARASGHQRAEAYAMVSLADIDREQDLARVAIEGYEQALALAGDVGEATLLTHALTGLSYACGQIGDLRKSEVLAQQALAGARERESPYEEGLAHAALGRLRHQQGRSDEAAGEFGTAVGLFEDVNAKKELAEALYHFAESRLPMRRHRGDLKATLERLAQTAIELGHDHFLVHAARRSPAVAQFGASRKIAGTFYRELLRLSASEPSEPAFIDAPTPGSDRFPSIEVTAFGSLEVRMGGRRVLDFEWESEKSKELFLLLLSRQRPLRRDEIIASLWPDAGGSRATSAFHSTLYRVRRALYPECIIESGGAYRTNPLGSFRYDVREFERLRGVAARMHEDDPRYLETLQSALGLYREPFAQGVDGEWAHSDRLSLERSFLEVAAKLADRLVQEGKQAEAAEAWQRLLEFDPYNEAACYNLMAARAASADYEAALSAYGHYAEQVELDFGEKPGQAIMQLYSEIRNRLGRPAGHPP